MSNMKKLPPRQKDGKFISPKKLFEKTQTVCLFKEHPYSTEKVGRCSKKQADQYMKDWGGHFIEQVS